MQYQDLGLRYCVARFAMAGILLLPFTVIAQSLPAQPSSAATTVSDSLHLATVDSEQSNNALVLLTPEAALEAPARLPAEARAAMLEQLRHELPEIAEALQLSADEAEQLLNLILERRVIERSAAGFSGEPDLSSQFLIDDLQQRQARIAALLGDRVGAYRAYLETLSERQRVHEFDLQLPFEEHLGAAQKSQLIGLLNEARQIVPPRSRFAILPADEAQSVLAARRFDVEREQSEWQRLAAATRLELQRAPEFLTPRQLELLVKLETARLQARRSFVENLRVAAGLEREIPE